MPTPAAYNVSSAGMDSARLSNVAIFAHDEKQPMSDIPAKVAVVDDDDLFREALGANLADEGFEVSAFDCGEDALRFFADGGRADIVLLDWRMPNLDGLEVLRRLRAHGHAVPVIFLTVLSDQIYEEAALSGGAIDFVEKSRSFPILLHRMQLIVDGRKLTSEAGDGKPAPTVVTQGRLSLNIPSGTAEWDGERVDLTLTEFKIVALMAQRAGENVSYREIYDVARGTGFVAGFGAMGYRANVRAFIKRIRQKFRALDDGFETIENYPGFGYRWQPADDNRSN